METGRQLLTDPLNIYNRRTERKTERKTAKRKTEVEGGGRESTYSNDNNFDVAF